MKNGAVRMKVFSMDSSEPLNSRVDFCSFVSKRIDGNSNNLIRLEYKFLKNFLLELKENLVEKYRSELREIDLNGIDSIGKIRQE